jgi:hypothetical protein
MSSLGVTVQGELFRHLFYHFVLTYSNWETGSICFSESFESLSMGFQNALRDLGGVPKTRQTDRLSAAINSMTNQAEFTDRYHQLLRHYGTEGKFGNAGCGNEAFEQKTDSGKTGPETVGGHFYLLNQVQKIATNLFWRQKIGRFLEKLGQLFYGADVSLLSFGGQTTQLHVLGHSLTKWCGNQNKTS